MSNAILRNDTYYNRHKIALMKDKFCSATIINDDNGEHWLVAEYYPPIANLQLQYDAKDNNLFLKKHCCANMLLLFP